MPVIHILCSAFEQSPRRREWKLPMRHVAVVEDSRLPTRELLMSTETWKVRASVQDFHGSEQTEAQAVSVSGSRAAWQA